MLHHGSVGVSSEWNRINLTVTPTINLLLFFIMNLCFYHHFYGLIIFMAYLWVIYYEALQNAFILISRCEIYPYYEYILLMWKRKCSRGCCFYVIIFFDIFLLTRENNNKNIIISWSVRLSLEVLTRLKF